MWNVNVIEQVLRGRAVMFLFPSSCRVRQRREGSWDNGGGSGVGDSVCMCVFYSVCSRYECLDLCVSRELYWKEGNEYWLKLNAHNLIIENVNCSVNCIILFVHLHVCQWLHSYVFISHDAKMGAIFTHASTSTVKLLPPRLYHLHIIHVFFPRPLCVCFFLSSVFLLQPVVVSILVERQCGSELGGGCSQG